MFSVRQQIRADSKSSNFCTFCTFADCIDLLATSAKPRSRTSREGLHSSKCHALSNECFQAAGRRDPRDRPGSAPLGERSWLGPVTVYLRPSCSLGMQITPLPLPAALCRKKQTHKCQAAAAPHVTAPASRMCRRRMATTAAWQQGSTLPLPQLTPQPCPLSRLPQSVPSATPPRARPRHALSASSPLHLTAHQQPPLQAHRLLRLFARMAIQLPMPGRP